MIILFLQLIDRNPMVKTLREFINDVEQSELDCIDEIFISDNGVSTQVLRERKWVDGRFEKNIGIDQPTSGAGQVHAHVLGRKRDEIGIINLDGTASHGKKMILHKTDAEAIEARGFTIPPNRIVEWIKLEGNPQFLAG